VLTDKWNWSPPVNSSRSSPPKEPACTKTFDLSSLSLLSQTITAACAASCPDAAGLGHLYFFQSGPKNFVLGFLVRLFFWAFVLVHTVTPHRAGMGALGCRDDGDGDGGPVHGRRQLLWRRRAEMHPHRAPVRPTRPGGPACYVVGSHESWCSGAIPSLSRPRLAKPMFFATNAAAAGNTTLSTMLLQG
jgi:hypothetical protein